MQLQHLCGFSVDVDAPSSGPPVLGLGHALDPLQMLRKDCCFYVDCVG